MNHITGFTDLCIPQANRAQLEAIIREAIELGFHNIAIEQELDLTNSGPSANKDDVVPTPYCLQDLKAAFQGQIRLFNRLTIIFGDALASLVLNRSSNIRSYDLIAALPTSESGMTYACQTMHCNIITYRSNTIRLRPNRKFYYLAVDRNIAFELKYAPAILSPVERKDTINCAHRYHSFGKSKNVVISSSAKNPFELRSPYDIANLGLIFGLSEEQSKEAIRGVPNRILLAAEGRRFGKAGVVITRRPKLTEDSDDYSDSELEEDVSGSDESEDVGSIVQALDGKDAEEQDVEQLKPPKKKAKHEV
ncbi:ribonuclease P protein subunit p30 [Anopheles stephensi]|uniref:ribonuclease P protein subunit p30 n=1 Tax=Anopheles stephensi TaxID=30069 RepID=UPI001658742D|nr:ribonuclease P protein subunit p30 [Anopheles stephensi]